MNKTELKKFAVDARRDLLEKVALKAEQYGITKENSELTIEENYGQLIVNGKTFPLDLKHALRTLQNRLNMVGYEQLIEEVAYTWFNRIIAIRYMEVNNYLPDRVNVLSSSSGKNEPDILLQYETMNLDVDSKEINDLIKTGETEQAFSKLFVAQCNNLNKVLPTLFEKINDYTELLLPDYLLDSEFIISKLVSNKELTESFSEVEVIGWLYQYYNTEPKDTVFAKLRKNKKAEKNEIPAATQFFTPKWIVQYMVENSLGQLWLEANPNSEIKKSLKYYIEPTTQAEEVKMKLEEIKYKSINLEEITIIDPCVGSGHILVYAFDLLYKMYEEAGYLSRDIPKLILEKNLFGLDIDNRSTQLASFALMMKAREKSRRILKQNIKLNIIAIEESKDIDLQGLINLLAINQQEQKEIELIINFYEDAKCFGSMLKPPKVDYNKYLKRIDSIDEVQTSLDTIRAYEQLNNFRKILTQSKLLVSQYDVAITNPPYMGYKGMNDILKKYVKKHYPNSKSDLYAVFIERLFKFTKNFGICSSITQHTWMFLISYEDLRRSMMNEQTLLSLLHLGTRAFDDINGEVVQTSSQVFRKINKNYNTVFYRLVDYQDSKSKKEGFLNGENKYINQQMNFLRIPGFPFAYWATDTQYSIFDNAPQLKEIADIRKGLASGNTERFIKYWYEVPNENIEFKTTFIFDKKWYPCHKGGSYRKWYGNLEKVINWRSNGEEIKSYRDENGKLKSRPQNLEYMFKKGIVFSKITSAGSNCRIMTGNEMFDDAVQGVFLKNRSIDVEYLLALLNSPVIREYLQLLNPTLNKQINDLERIPILKSDKHNLIVDKTRKLIQISKNEWDEVETSWDFSTNPLLKFNTFLLIDSYKEYKNFLNRRLELINKLENKINLELTNLYKMELTTIKTNNDEFSKDIIQKDQIVQSILSYFIGCSMGRYSLDNEGLAYAGGEFDESMYKSFKPNSDGLILLTDDQYFENDIIVRLREFLSVAFSPDTVEENMRWIAESLEMKKNESPEERLRRYFLDEFFKDHCKTYQKRPIYWLVDSGKQKGLRTLIYMHRYQPDTMATIRFDHLQEIQAKYQNEIEMIDTRLANPSLSATDRRTLEKAKIAYQKKIEELQEFDKHLAVYANEQIEIDLDDGVKVNYPKFDKVLAKIK